MKYTSQPGADAGRAITP